MPTSIQPKFFCAAASVCVAAMIALPATAHHVGDAVLTPAATPSLAVPTETMTGTLDELVVDNKVTGTATRYVALRQLDGQSIALQGSGLSDFKKGTLLEASGQRSGNTLFVASARAISHSATTNASTNKTAQAQPMQVEGTLLLAHADDFATSQSRYMLNVQEPDGTTKALDVAVLPDTLQRGMSVIASGSLADDGFSIAASRIVITALPSAKADGEKKPTGKDATTNNVLVLLVKFTDSPADGFTPAQAQQVLTSNANSVSAYYNETSYGQHLLNVTVTSSWLQAGVATPAGCDYNTVAGYANTAASAAGYNVGTNPPGTGAYQNIFYVFPSNSSCGWAGLAYIGYGRAWSNGYNLLPVFAHELGHNFGLYHAASLRCSGAAITTGSSGCSSSEYGDPFSVMGGQGTSSVAMHFNAAQKRNLNWIPSSAVATYSSGTSTYTLTPLETSGGSTYAVKIAASATRTYWLEYRQPIGVFDNAFAYPNNGVQIRLASPFETLCGGCADDTELLDMTPATTGSDFHDAALLAGQSFTDATSGFTVSVLAASASALTLQVGPAAGAGNTVVTSVSNPANFGNVVTFTATVSGTSPTGNVSFTDGGSTIAGCSALPLSGSGNTRSATCTTSSLSVGQHSIVASYAGDSGNPASASSALTETINAAVTSSRADFNADGRSDILWRQASTGSVLLQTMNGASAASSTMINASSDWAVAGVGDFNGDGKADVLWQQLSTGNVLMQTMNGPTVIASFQVNGSSDWSVAGVGDFNGDGRADILWKQNSTGNVLLQIMNGATATSSTLISSSSDWVVANVGDFNGDGKADILWRQTSTGNVMMQLMNGASATASYIANSNSDWIVAGVGDFNGDGKADILWQQVSTGTVLMELMNGPSTIAAYSINTNANWTVAGVGDFNGDGKADILWRQTSSGVVLMQLMNGATVTSSNIINSSGDWLIAAPK